MSEEISEIISARWVITVNPKKEIFENHSLLISHEKIHSLLPTPLALSQYPNTKHTNLSDRHALIPGLINMHTHTAMSLLRAVSEGLDLHQWLQKCIWPLEKEFVSEEYVNDAMEIGCHEMIRQGQTCINDMYFFPNVSAEVVDRIGFRACLGMPIIGFPTNYSVDGFEAIEKGKELVEKYKENERIKIVVAPHAPYTISDELWKASLECADELNLKIHTHLHETKFETENVDERAISRLNRLGIINDRLIAVHMTQLNDEERELLAKKGSSVVHCPESNLKLGSGICDIDLLFKVGVNVAIGTDGVASNDDSNLLGEVTTASLLNKYKVSLVGDLSHALPSHKFLEMATINGAKALGLDHLIGSLEVGKKADITAIEILAEPVYSIANNIVSVGTNRVSDVWVNGKRLLEDGKCLVLDEKTLVQKARFWGEKITNYLNIHHINNAISEN